MYQHTGVEVIPTRVGKDEIIEKVRPKFVDKYMVVVEPTSMYWPEDDMEHVTQREDGRVYLEKVLPKFEDTFTKLFNKMTSYTEIFAYNNVAETDETIAQKLDFIKS